MQVSGEMTGKVWDSAAIRCAGSLCLSLPLSHYPDVMYVSTLAKYDVSLQMAQESRTMLL